MGYRKSSENLNSILDEIARMYGETGASGYTKKASDRKLAPILRTSSEGIRLWRNGESRPSVASEDAIAEALGWPRYRLVAFLEDVDPIDLICWGVYLLRKKELNSRDEILEDNKYKQIERLQQAMMLLSSTDLAIKKQLGENRINMINLSEKQANKLSRLIIFLESKEASGYDFFGSLDIAETEKERLHMVIHFCQVERPIPRETLDILSSKLPVVSEWNPIKVRNVFYKDWSQLQESLDNGTRSLN